MGKRFLHNRAAVVTVAIVLLIGLIGILAPVLAPHDPYANDILNKFAPYSTEYPLGTDHLGRCVLSRLIYGIRPTLGLALLTMLGTIALGAVLGIMAGYFRGVVEEVIMRVVDVMLSFPSQIMVFAVVGLLGINVQNVIIANVFIKWAWYARMIRTATIKYTGMNFVLFSRSIGSGNFYILTRHMLPCILRDLADHPRVVMIIIEERHPAVISVMLLPVDHIVPEVIQVILVFLQPDMPRCLEMIERKDHVQLMTFFPRHQLAHLHA